MPPITTSGIAEIPFLINAVLTRKVTIDASAIDAGNTGQTHILRGGLPLASSSALSGRYVHYQTAGANGTDTGDFILMETVDLKDGDPAATATNHTGVVLVIGSVKSGKVLLQDAALIADLAKTGTGEGFIIFES